VIQEEIPNAKFLYQDNQENFEEIKNYSIFPFFTTNVSKLDPHLHKELANDRVPVEIEDDAAEMTFYASFLKSNRARLEPVIEAWQDGWIRID
ncbi:MAG: LysR family transcriptional regulator, partial [Enterococcus sp.]